MTITEIHPAPLDDGAPAELAARIAYTKTAVTTKAYILVDSGAFGVNVRVNGDPIVAHLDLVLGDIDDVERPEQIRFYEHPDLTRTVSINVHGGQYLIDVPLSQNQEYEKWTLGPAALSDFPKAMPDWETDLIAALDLSTAALGTLPSPADTSERDAFYQLPSETRAAYALTQAVLAAATIAAENLRRREAGEG